ncbi:hypothetical protein ILYODFUR_034093 [Ilyodon furcidens]|uniref:Uncharacterized protein n=1 Tax=Ilyodon furcidens TaxID=33524 RepID=A0ABV0TQV2_9TELE
MESPGVHQSNHVANCPTRPSISSLFMSCCPSVSSLHLLLLMPSAVLSANVFSPLLHCNHCGTITTAAALMAIDAAEGPPAYTLARTNIHKKFMTAAQWEGAGVNLASLGKNKCHPAEEGRGTC